MPLPKKERKHSVCSGGRGTGRPPDQILYGKRIGVLVNSYPDPIDARKKAAQLEKDGILAVTRKWYSQTAVYRCGLRK